MIAGSLLFGIGWGLAGICPGPGIVPVGYGSLKGNAFVLALYPDDARRRATEGPKPALAP